MTRAATWLGSKSINDSTTQQTRQSLDAKVQKPLEATRSSDMIQDQDSPDDPRVHHDLILALFSWLDFKFPW